MVITDKIRHAQYFATDKHVIQKRQKYGVLPYTHHLEAVARVLERFGVDDEDFLVAAWLHDCLEDTDTKFKELEEVFGTNVAELVFAVTDELDSDGKPQKSLTYPKIRAEHGAILIKLADRIANVENGGSMVKKYKKVYEEFRRNLYTPPARSDSSATEEMWNHLDKLMDYNK